MDGESKDTNAMAMCTCCAGFVLTRVEAGAVRHQLGVLDECSAFAICKYLLYRRSGLEQGAFIDVSSLGRYPK